MQKIKILTDSTCDIPAEDEKRLGIRILNFPVTVDGEAYRERQDFTNEQFYEMTDNAKEMPKTSQLTTIEIAEAFKELYREGWTDVIYVTISSTGSATYNNAKSAVIQFNEETAGSGKPKMRIYIVDSKGYSGMYGYAVMQAAEKARRGENPEDIVDYLVDWTSRSEAHFVPMSLKYVKKSGRITAAAAFVGELLGLRPIIKLAGGGSEILEKIRGEKNIIPKLLADAEKNMEPDTPYLVVCGRDRTLSQKLADEMTKKFGYPPEYFNQIGAAVTCNTGPDLVGLIFRGKSK
ncbi:MAG: DegV family protein [Porcipelethomonas sp.]